ncbi:hypothetical protein V6N13_133422 [Hibiscus sabdariffa]|uniref:Uncharacterized protein n=1 Tax=Hibiscus sabdariffa TaxID=183260 RepID=A0ABR2CIT8_9ROSI
MVPVLIDTDVVAVGTTRDSMAIGIAVMAEVWRLPLCQPLDFNNSNNSGINEKLNPYQLPGQGSTDGLSFVA